MKKIIEFLTPTNELPSTNTIPSTAELDFRDSQEGTFAVHATAKAIAENREDFLNPNIVLSYD